MVLKLRDKLPNKNVLFVCLGFFFVFLGFDGAQQYLIPLLTLDNRQDIALTALIIIYATFLVSNIVAPKLISMIGLKRSLVVGAVTYLVFVLSIVAKSDFFLCLAAVMIGIGASLLWNGSGQIIALNSSNDAGKNYGLQYFGVMIGGLLGVALGAMLLSSAKIELIFFLYSIPILVGIFMLSRTKVKEVKGSKDIQFRPASIFNPKMLLLFPVIFSGYFVSAQVLSSVNLLVIGLYGIAVVGLLSTIYKLSASIGGVFNGAISSRISKAKILMTLSAIGFLAICLLLNNTGIVMVTIAVILLGLFVSSVYPVTLALLNERVNKEEYSQALSVFHVYGIFGMLAALIANLYLDPKVSFWPVMLLIPVSIVTTFLFNIRVKRP